MAEPVKPTTSQGRRLPAWLQVLLVLGALLLLNAVLQPVLLRLDLTADHRFTLNPVTEQTLDSLREPVFVQVYLAGSDFPPTIKRFQTAIQNTLTELQARGNGRLQFDFRDPRQDTAALKRFRAQGLAPLPVKIASNDLTTQETLLFPFAEVRTASDTETLDLMAGTAAEANINALLRAESDLEFKFTGALRRLALRDKPIIGILQGHGELEPSALDHFLAAASPAYRIGLLQLPPDRALEPRRLPSGTPATPGAIQADIVLVAQPQSALSEADKFRLDQYLMRGGRIVWLLDALTYSSIDLQAQGSALWQPQDLNLADQLLRYGLKLRTELVQDLYCGYLDAIQTVNGRDVTSQQRFVYFPRAVIRQEHPALRNVDQVLLRFAGGVDTIARPGVRFTPLLLSSPIANRQEGSIVLDLDRAFGISRQQPPALELLRQTQDGFLLGVLAEGRFPSAFAARPRPAGTGTFAQLETAIAPGAQVLVGDGDIILGNHSQVGPRGLPLDNLTFLLNTLDYLAGDAALTAMRGRDVQVRTLDPLQVRGSEWTIRALNLALPLVLVVLFGVGYAWQRRRRNARA